MSTILSFVSGGALVASLSNLSPEALGVMFGVLFGTMCAVCAIYLYVRANYQPPRRAVRRSVRSKRIVTSVYGWQPVGVFA